MRGRNESDHSVDGWSRSDWWGAYQPQAHVRVMLDPAGHPFCLYTDDKRSSPAP